MSASARAGLLAALLAALGLALFHPGAVEILGGMERYRQAVVWGLPVAAGLLALLLGAPFAPRRPSAPWTSGPSETAAAIRLLPAVALFVAADQSFLALAAVKRWATFSYGAQGFSQHVGATVLLGLPIGLTLGLLGWERALRGGVLGGLASPAGPLPVAAAAALSMAVGLVLALPAIFPAGEVPEVPYAAAAFLATVCREAAFCAFFLRGGLLAAGCARGLLVFVQTLAVDDWYAASFPAATYVAANPALYALRAATAVLALAVALRATRRVRGASRVAVAEEASRQVSAELPEREGAR